MVWFCLRALDFTLGNRNWYELQSNDYFSSTSVPLFRSSVASLSRLDWKTTVFPTENACQRTSTEMVHLL